MAIRAAKHNISLFLLYLQNTPSVASFKVIHTLVGKDGLGYIYKATRSWVTSGHHHDNVSETIFCEIMWEKIECLVLK